MTQLYYTPIGNIAWYRPMLDEVQAKNPGAAIHVFFGNSTAASIGTHPPDWNGKVVEVRL